MTQDKTDSHKIEKNGWKQGSCLYVDEATTIYTATQCMQEQLPAGLYLVLSHDCDILNPSLTKEPFVELIATSKIQQCNKELIAGKNPRQLHLYTNKKRLLSRSFPPQTLFH